MKKEISKPIYDLDEYVRQSHNQFAIGLIAAFSMFLIGIIPGMFFGLAWMYSYKYQKPKGKVKRFFFVLGLAFLSFLIFTFLIDTPYDINLLDFIENVNKKDKPNGKKIRFAFTKRKR